MDKVPWTQYIYMLLSGNFFRICNRTLLEKEYHIMRGSG